MEFTNGPKTKRPRSKFLGDDVENLWSDWDKSRYVVFLAGGKKEDDETGIDRDYGEGTPGFPFEEIRGWAGDAPYDEG